MNKKTICITGGSGFLGRELISFLSKKYKIINMSRDRLKFSGLIINRSDILIHAAAITDPFNEDLRKVNVGLTKTLVSQSIKSRRLKKIVYISSENVSYNFNDPYSISKKDAENIISTFNNYLIIRPSILFGDKDNRYIKKYAKLIKFFPIIPVFPSKYSTIQPLHVNDLAKIILSGIENNITGTFTIIGTKPISFKHLGCIIARIYNKKVIFVDINIILIKIFILILRFINRRFSSMLKNALIVRDTNIINLEKIFRYKFPRIEKRLKESII